MYLILAFIAIPTLLAVAGVFLLLKSRRPVRGEQAPRVSPRNPRRATSQLSLESARKRFALRREWLEADFITKAGASGRPRGLRWAGCDFDNDVTFARERHSGNFRALVSVTIQFEAIEGGGMEDVEAVSNLRSATAVFFVEDDAWQTDGRAVFNLDPSETIHHFQHELEAVA